MIRRYASWEELESARRSGRFVSERQATGPSNERLDGRERHRPATYIARENRERIVRHEKKSGDASIVCTERPRNLDARGTRNRHHVAGPGDLLVHPALARDARVARAEYDNQRAEEPDERGDSPHAPQAGEDHPESIAGRADGASLQGSVSLLRLMCRPLA